MKHGQHIAIVGSGPSAIYLIKHILERAGEFRGHLEGIALFEKSPLTGTGMPFSPLTTDRFHLSNISSEEMPELPVSLVDWLGEQTDDALETLHVERNRINRKTIYSRLTLGSYLKSQYRAMTASLAGSGIQFKEHAACGVEDIRDLPADRQVEILTVDGTRHRFDRVVIASGHIWPDADVPAAGYFASPWPIAKILPGEGRFFNHTVGTLGASLSAFDVITSLSHRHGKFEKKSGGMRFSLHAEAQGFRISMHSADGLLPHLQYAQAESMRQIYRHIDKDAMLGLAGEDGFLRLDTYLDSVCRPVLIDAFQEDGLPEIAGKLADHCFGWEEFVEMMAGRHTYDDPFEGMREELEKAYVSVAKEKPAHWKEALDDLIYTLNFHAELLSAEDHARLRSVILPFLLNIVAALPLESAETLLALHSAGCLELVAGKIVEVRKDAEEGTTTVEIEDSDKNPVYGTFVDCSGQHPVEVEGYPFPSLARDNTIRPARAAFATPSAAAGIAGDSRMFEEAEVTYSRLAGIDVDPSGHVIGHDGLANPRIVDISFPHTSGIRPYSYGLQACSETAGIIAGAMLSSFRKGGTCGHHPL